MFQMTKEPTSREMPAKTSSTVVKMPRPSLTVFEDSPETCSEVTAWVPGGSTWGNPVPQLHSGNAGLGPDVHLVDLARLAQQALGGGRVERGQRGTGQAVRITESHECPLP